MSVYIVFVDIVTTISKLSKECVLRIAEDKLYFIVSDDNNGPAPPILWCEIPQAMFFSEFQMLGIDEEHKDIYLGFVPGTFIHSYKHLDLHTVNFELRLLTSLKTRRNGHN